MSLCHPDFGNVSCGACCGLFNLKLQPKEFKTLLSERTSEFYATVDFEVRHTFPIYRKERETKEVSIPKKDDMTYNCPFLGYVDSTKQRIGCMIHPIFTGDPKSQNFSFYGASICQAYDCKNKESVLAGLWESFFVEIAKDSVEYSYLSADHIFTSAIERYFQLIQRNIDSLFQELRLELVDLFRTRLTSSIDSNLTSFEINYENFSELEALDIYFTKELGEYWKEWSEVFRQKNPG
ncbi:hypothetical protein ND861_00095 [Leptospira sp. 2 VSF19]|uniref:Uncharacterized protein n=1 Tax=Leptospira soteropolitanensis TaxID=2950025 RepID=A0AAW5VHB8_9LEPT|nr:hypothetical protein [Leptospira soteropolitanensis]MCW7491040.1 hypothetical protein [Leptospira soteropolitanensis]MCW7498624.1 hypothetical protein [Leptospira soteropolitanensis]MCW7521783.1 hypothetical protein [Leptospira soteropolitanensis]MCW7524728.1 hypothetical protein [Leptospira soteropolitanensis]MCW7528595.1 hypothetical protein [Leptospira soteropolitanensis]